MNYSCAFFDNPEHSLADAQGNKTLTSIERLDTKPDMHVLDIGCGWGNVTREICNCTDAAKTVGITLA